MAYTQQAPLKTTLPNKPEPSQIIGDLDLTGKRVVITGGHSGIGLETSRALAGAGAEVYIPARSPSAARTALASVDGTFHVAPMDLSDLGSVIRLAQSLVELGNPIDLLINNAGVMACPELRVGDNWEAQFATNHLGHFILTNGLLPLLRKANGARVVCLSSIAHKRADVHWDDIHFQNTPYDKWLAYAQSKTANALHAIALDDRYQENNIRAFAVHPGGIMTPLQRHLTQEEMIVLGWIDEHGETPDAAKPFFKTPAQGAATTLWAATSQLLDGMGGVYCEDCNIAALMSEQSPRYTDVASWAVDREAAARLWDISAAMTAAAF